MKEGNAAASSAGFPWCFPSSCNYSGRGEGMQDQGREGTNAPSQDRREARVCVSAGPGHVELSQRPRLHPWTSFSMMQTGRGGEGPRQGTDQTEVWCL